MNSERIKEIQEQTAYPESRSLHQALSQVWNECQQENNKEIESLKKELEVTDKLLDARNEVLSLIPECDVHGFCLPHFKEWIIKHNTSN